MESSHPSLWTRTTPSRMWPPLERDRAVDVAIVGGGITGITAAILLKEAGLSVGLLEARELAGGTSGFTTAHITAVLDTRYAEIARKHGREGARRVATSQQAAIDRIAAMVERFGLDCGFRRLPAYLYTEDERGIGELHRELAAARDAGLRVSMQTDAPLPFTIAGALRFEQQATFHPLRYLRPLAERIPDERSFVCEFTRVLDVEDGQPCLVRTERGTVRARHVVIATHHPINKVFLHTKIAAYRSYVVTARVRHEIPDALYWDTADPYHYIRLASDDRGALLVVGGEDHKVAEQRHESDSFDRLAAYVKDRFDADEIVDRWSAQVLEPVDGLPYIGRNAASERVFVATGFSGNGMTGGTLGGMIVSDLVLGRKNAWADVYEATRLKPLASLRQFVSENKDYPKNLVRDRLQRAEARSLEEIAPGQGRLVRLGGETLAVYRHDDGRLTAVSPVCTHLYCHVHFNDAERTWDCPCHGSRFDVSGEVLDGPAVQALEPREIPGIPGDSDEEPAVRVDDGPSPVP